MPEKELEAWEALAVRRLDGEHANPDTLRVPILVAEVRRQREEIETLRAALRAVLVCGCGIGPCECAEDYRPAARAALDTPTATTTEGES